jgi:hypothetical protein
LRVVFESQKKPGKPLELEYNSTKNRNCNKENKAGERGAWADEETGSGSVIYFDASWMNATQVGR